MRSSLVLAGVVSVVLSCALPWAALAETESYGYDPIGRLVRVTRPDGSVITYSYDNAGNRTSKVVLVGNQPPVAANDVRSTPRDVATTFDPRVNDSDANGDALTIVSVTAPAHGASSFTASSLTYTPTAGYVGADSISYTISDGNGGTASATVSLTVTSSNLPPDAVNDSKVAQKNTALVFDPRTNDTDPNGDPLSVIAVGQAAHGSVVFTTTSITYTPMVGYTGADSLTYTLGDGAGGTDTATVSITVNGPPVATADTASTAQNTAVVLDPRANDSDPDGGSLSITGKTNGSHGTVAFTATSVTYTPVTGYTGADSFTYVLSDGQGATATGTVSVTVTGGVADGTVLFTQSTGGAFGFTIPAGVAFVDIEGWGGGGNGGWIDLSPFGGFAAGGDGGGYFKKHIAVTPGLQISGTVGAALAGNTAVASPALTAQTGSSFGMTGGAASGGDLNVTGSPCCFAEITDGGGAGNGGGDQTTPNANGTPPGGGGAGTTGLGAPGRITITARTN